MFLHIVKIHSFSVCLQASLSVAVASQESVFMPSIHISYVKVAQTSWPRAVVSTDPGVDVTEDEQRFLWWNFADGSTEVIIEPILQF